jgi:hypothetical protein
MEQNRLPVNHEEKKKVKLKLTTIDGQKMEYVSIHHQMDKWINSTSTVSKQLRML